MTSMSLTDLFRPFLWLAVFAFFAGFSVCLMVGLSGRSVAASTAPDGLYSGYERAAERSAEVPAPTGAWTFEKHI